MFGSNVLDIAIGVVFVYLLLSLLCATINEQIIVRILNLRAKMLEDGINGMLAGPKGAELAKQFYESALIQSLSQRTASGKIRKPSYIPANIFACALINTDTVREYRNESDKKDTPIPAALALLLTHASFDPAREQAIIEQWFNATMERVSGWYKRRVQVIILVLGLVVAIALNIDSLALITNLSNNAAERAVIVSAAQGYTTSHSSNSDLKTLEENIQLYQPSIGWSGEAKDYPADPEGWVFWIALKVIGLLATAFAVSLGAPFWFDLLNKFVSLRSSGTPPSTPPSKSTAPASSTNTITEGEAITNALINGFQLQQASVPNGQSSAPAQEDAGATVPLMTPAIKLDEAKSPQE